MPDETPAALREAYDLLNHFHRLDEGSAVERTLNSKYLLHSVYRMIIMELHLSIESLLKDLIYSSLPQRRTFSAKENKSYVQRLGFAAATELAARLGLLTSCGYDELVKLNQIRNRSAHDWLLGAFTLPKGSKGTPRRRRYKVEFNGKNLFNPEVMKEEFLPHYGDVYLEFYAVTNGLRWKRRYISY
jgi:hypothetical protein